MDDEGIIHSNTYAAKEKLTGIERTEAKNKPEYDTFVPTTEPLLKVMQLRPPGYFFGLACTGDAGFDLHFHPEDARPALILAGGEAHACQTGIAVAIPEGYAGLVLPRSGIATKRGLRPRNTPGLIDSGYRGEIIVSLENVSQERQLVQPGTRIAQLVLVPVLTPLVQIVESLDETERGAGGFGSSGT